MAKFTSIDLSAHVARSGAGEADAWHPGILEALETLPAGRQTFWGIPFALGAAEENGERWLVLDRNPQEVEVAAQARYVVVAHFCNISPLPAHPDALKLTVLRAIPEPGEHLADYKKPREVHFAQNLPYSPQGKLLKRELRRQHEAEHSTAGR